MESWIVFILGFTQFLVALQIFSIGRYQRFQDKMNQTRFEELERRLDGLSSYMTCNDGLDKGVENGKEALDPNLDSAG